MIASADMAARRRGCSGHASRVQAMCQNMYSYRLRVQKISSRRRPGSSRRAASSSITPRSQSLRKGTEHQLCAHNRWEAWRVAILSQSE